MVKTIDPYTLDQWYPVATCDYLFPGQERNTCLLGTGIRVQCNLNGEFSVEMLEKTENSELPILKKYDHVWTSLGSPPPDLFQIPEVEEKGRRSFGWDAVTVKTSGLRAIENFLDLAHFPYVHTDILGAEPFTEVTPYQVDIRNNEIWVENCAFNQPKAAAIAEGSIDVDYTYRVPHPFVSILYKTCPLYLDKRDVIALFVQPKEEALCDIYTFASLFDNENSDVSILRFQLEIFLQDRLILENQVPKCLPLNLQKETPSRADKSSIAYRRWLMNSGLQYGAIVD